MNRILLIIFLCLPSLAEAYPSYISKGYTNCGSCHYSPIGGGMTNSYGSAAQSATFPDTIHSESIQKFRERMTKNDVTGYKEDDGKTKELQWDAGLDARALLLLANTGSGEDDGGSGGGKQAYFFPMLFEVAGVLAYGPWITYGSVTPRRAGASQTPDSIFSREHWVGYKLNESSMIRSGRLVLPFGIRSPDHTLYTREDFGFDKWDQSYGMEWDFSSERWMVSAAGFAGDLILDPTDRQQRGGVASIAYNFPGKATIGVSFLSSVSKFMRTNEGSLFSRSKFLQHFYVMEEVDLKRDTSTENLGNTDELASMFRFGMFPIESLDIYFEAATRRMFGQSELNKTRYSIGSQWQILPWAEFIPVVMLETFNSTREITPMAQFHIIF